MRMRLARNYNYNRHKDASNLRDTGQSPSSTPLKEKAESELLAKVTKRTSASLEEEDFLLEQLWSDANASSTVREGMEDVTGSKERKLLKGVQCNLIMLMESIPGRLEITSKHLYFLSDQNDKTPTQTCKECITRLVPA